MGGPAHEDAAGQEGAECERSDSDDGAGLHLTDSLMGLVAADATESWMREGAGSSEALTCGERRKRETVGTDGERIRLPAEACPLAIYKRRVILRTRKELVQAERSHA